MTPDDIGRHGTALMQRVQRQVDAGEGLRRTRRWRLRFRLGWAVAAAVAVVAILVGIGNLDRSEPAPPASPPTTDTEFDGRGLQPLPLDLSIVLVDSFEIDADGVTCAGVGSLSGARSGAVADFVDASLADTLDEAGIEPLASIRLGNGVVADEGVLAPLGVPVDQAPGCRFLLDATGLATDDIMLSPSSLGVRSGGFANYEVGRRLTFVIGGDT